MEKILMTGNEGIARGFYEAGGKIATSYPGSPTVSIVEVAKQYENVYAEFSTNEKVALEVAIGGSFAGVRSMVSMKHVGLNIAFDPLMTFTETPTNGGFVLITGDDPGLKSSQNEQDNRILGKFANMPIFDPSDAEDAKVFTKEAFELSEKHATPVMVRITSRLCHSRSIVTCHEPVIREDKERFEKSMAYAMIPPESVQAQKNMCQRLEDIRLDESLRQWDLHEKKGSDTLLVTSGISYQYIKELDLGLDILKLALIYPLDPDYIKNICKAYRRVVVVEEMMPFIENEFKLMGLACEGKKYFSYTGELNTPLVKNGLIKAGLVEGEEDKLKPMFMDTVKRLPLFCAGCPHRPIYDMIKKSKADIVIGDIGCYSLAILEPTNISHTVISMGASVGISKGLYKGMALKGKKEPIVSIIGDGTFFHSGIPSFINMLHQTSGDENITFLILDNKTTAMTGGQHNGSSGSFNHNDDLNVDIPLLLNTIGFERVKEINQYNYKEAKEVMQEELKYEGISVVIARGPCALKYKLNNTPYYVDEKVCIHCRTCIRTNCPPLQMKNYPGIKDKKSFIDSDTCVGCGVCSQVCPVNAIQLKEAKG